MLVTAAQSQKKMLRDTTIVIAVVLCKDVMLCTAKCLVIRTIASQKKGQNCNSDFQFALRLTHRTFVHNQGRPIPRGSLSE